MTDITCRFAGITSPNPFWLASAPPTDKAYNVNRAFEAGWGGVVWKTLGLDPPVVNVSSRYGAVNYNGQRIAGLNNIELITDRPLAVNLAEIRQVKRDWPDRPTAGWPTHNPPNRPRQSHNRLPACPLLVASLTPFPPGMGDERVPGGNLRRYIGCEDDRRGS